MNERQQITKVEGQLDYLLLDGSGSMAPKWNDTLSAVDAYVSTLKSERVSTSIYFHMFADRGDTDIEVYNGPILECPRMLGLSQPGECGTALYDAIAIMGRRMRDFDPAKGRIVIFTDGDEASSKFTDLHQAKSILDWCRAKGWPVTFIGCDFANAAQAKALGSDSGSSVGVAQARLSDATTSLAKKAARHALYGEDIGFSSSEQQQFGGYLAGPSK